MANGPHFIFRSLTHFLKWDHPKTCHPHRSVAEWTCSSLADYSATS